MKDWFIRHISDYGMLSVLAVLCVFFSVITLTEQHPEGAGGGKQLARQIVKKKGEDARVLIVTRQTSQDTEFVDAVRESFPGAEAVQGQPTDAREALEKLAAQEKKLDVIACNRATMNWTVFDNVSEQFPVLGTPERMAPRSYLWPDFLKRDNLLNIAGQISIIAIIAIGMTFVIIAAGIDLSVGSLIALAAVLAAWLIRAGGGTEASVWMVLVCCLAAIGFCAVIGLFTGSMVTFFQMPPFIVTLAMMLLARGLAQTISGAETISEVPTGFTWLGRDATIGEIPNAAVLMLFLYGLAHLILAKTKYGRYVYAVGGNEEAARLSGVPVRRITVSVYVVSAALAGLGGVMMASLLGSGSHTFGVMYELYVIAAVVVGGASLSGGMGKMLGTLIGAFIIAVIRNGMNLLGLKENWQLIVMGVVILAAVLLDRLKKQWLESSKVA